MSDSNEIDFIIKNAIAAIRCRMAGEIETPGLFWKKIDDLAGSCGVYCNGCYKTVWTCDCFTERNMGGNFPPSLYLTPKQCKCETKRPWRIINSGYYSEELICLCLIPVSTEQYEELGELMKKRIHLMDLQCGPRDQRKRHGWMKMYGEQINYLVSEVSTLKNEVSILKTALADALDALAQK